MKNLRFEAMKWWNHLSDEHKEKCLPDGSNRNPESLTGMEIEGLYRKLMKEKFVTKVLNILATDLPHTGKIGHIKSAAYDTNLAEINKEGQFEIL